MLKNGMSPWRRRALPWAAVCAAGLVTAACQGSAPAKSAAPARKPAAPAAHFTITPAQGAANVRPGQRIVVTATDATIRDVTVAGSADPGTRVTGRLNPAGTLWRSDWTLPVSSRLTVTATGVSKAGKAVTDTSTFRTVKPSATFSTMIFEGQGQTYGVGMPIILDFSRPIRDRAAVERSLQIRTSKPVVGAWYWDNSQTLDFRPRTYWPANTKVSFVAHLDGVQGAPGVYGARALTQQFRIGQSLIVIASTATHHMRLYRSGKLIAYWPISTGAPGDDTPNGTYLTIEKANPTLMTGPGYSLEVPWSVRFTWTGDYLHDAYWSVAEQGYVNVSHGCVNMPPADAEIYYNMAVPGDPVTIVGSPLAGTWDNGWTEWFLNWHQLLRGSALHKAVLTGPHGSRLVSPSSLFPSIVSAPLGRPWPRNARAS